MSEIALTWLEGLVKERKDQGEHVFVPHYGVNYLTGLRKRLYTLYLLAYKFPRSEHYLKLTRRNREDPRTLIETPDDPRSRQIHRPRREACQLMVCCWLAAEFNHVTRKVVTTARELGEQLKLGVKRIPRAIKDLQDRGVVDAEKKKGKRPGEEIVTITVLEPFFGVFGLGGRADQVRDRLIGKERTEKLNEKARECRAREAEDRWERKRLRKEERAEPAWLEPYLHDLASRHGPLPKPFIAEIKRLIARGITAPPLHGEHLLKNYQAMEPRAPP